MKDVSFHLFPKQKQTREAWLTESMRGEQWVPSKNTVICSLHFDPSCFTYTRCRRRLKKNAVPGNSNDANIISLG